MRVDIDDGHLYRQALMRKLVKEKRLCGYCLRMGGPRRGENAGYGRYSMRNWKRYRKNRWKG